MSKRAPLRSVGLLFFTHYFRESDGKCKKYAFSITFLYNLIGGCEKKCYICDVSNAT